jgi:16S rRNA (guanine527-N7)-methyltransferase
MDQQHLSDEKIKETLAAYRFHPDQGHCAAIRSYMSLLLRWNQRVSLTTVVDPIEILRFHFGESLFAASSVPIGKGRLADVGSGAGFPALPLRMATQELEVTLIESNAKKTAFLSEVVRNLGLDQVEVLRLRAQQVKSNALQFDYVTARAVGDYKALLSWSSERLTPHGMLILWLGQDDARAIAGEDSWIWREPMLIPGSTRRYILVGSPAAEI